MLLSIIHSINLFPCFVGTRTKAVDYIIKPLVIVGRLTINLFSKENFQNNLYNLRINPVVKFWDYWMVRNPFFIYLCSIDFNSRQVLFEVQPHHHGEPCSGGCLFHEFLYCLVIGKDNTFHCPVHLAEQAVLDGVPL